MLGYIIKRTLYMVPTLVLISMVVFMLIELPPGDYFESYVAQLLASGESVDMQKIEFLRQQYGFDLPPYERYFKWVFGMLQGDFGYSHLLSNPPVQLG
jgi:peptide/nickel transport system permease protein